MNVPIILSSFIHFEILMNTGRDLDPHTNITSQGNAAALLRGCQKYLPKIYYKQVKVRIQVFQILDQMV